MKLQDLIPITREGAGKGDRSERVKNRADKQVVVGGMPLVSLLPKEMLDASSRRSSRRALMLAVGGVALITTAVIAASTLAASDAHARLDESNRQLANANAQVAKFGDLQREQQQIALGQAAVDVGGSTAIDWSAQVAGVESVMPSDFSITSITTTSAEPGVAFVQSVDPLDPPRVATMTITATATSISALPTWLRELRSLPAYASASPAVTTGAGAGDTGYTVVITLNLDKAAFTRNTKGTTE